MSGCLHSARWALSIFLVFLFIILVMVGLPSVAITRSAASRETVKSWLEESGIYFNAVDTIGGFLDTMNNQQDETESEEKPAEGEMVATGDEQQEELQTISYETIENLESLFTPEKLKTMATEAVDGLYDWFEGKTTKPQIMIEIAEDTDELMDILMLGLDSKLESLPPCDPGIGEQQDFNPYEAECLPEGFDSGEMESFLTENQSEEELEELRETMKFTTEDMEITAETTEDVQNAYWVVKNTYLIITGIYVLLLIILLLLIPDFPAKLHVTGISTLIAAGLVLAGTYFSSFLYDIIWENIATNIPEDQLSSLESTVGSLTEVAMNDVLSQIRIWSICTMIFGAFLVTIAVVISVLKKKKAPDTPKGVTPQYQT